MDKLTSMAIFKRAVELGSFSAVAREMEISQPSVSKHISTLESLLGTRLINRNTRHLSITEAGKEYYDYCLSILDDVSEAEARIRQDQSQVSGMLRISIPTTYGLLEIIPQLWSFLDKYPDLKLDLQLDDHTADLVKEGIDLAIRIGPLQNSTLIARKLGECPRLTVAHPNYLEKYGEPKNLKDLKRHNCLIFTLLSTRNEWYFDTSKGRQKVTVSGRFSVNNPQVIRAALLAEVGIAVAPEWLIKDCLEDGRLSVILRDYQPTAMEIHAVYPARKFVPHKVRYFIDHIRNTMENSDADPEGKILSRTSPYFPRHQEQTQ